MDKDLTRTFNNLSRQDATDLERDSCTGVAGDWSCTGLCPEAQADGVPCTEVGRSCDICGHAKGRVERNPGRPS